MANFPENNHYEAEISALKEELAQYKQLASMQNKLVEETLLANQKKYSIIFNTINEAIFIYEAKTEALIDTNQAMLDMYGFSRNEVFSLTANDYSAGYSPYSSLEASQWFKKAQKNGPQLFEWKARKKNGQEFWVEIALKVFFISDQERIIAVVRDITDRKIAHQQKLLSEQKFRTLFENINDGILILSLEGKFLEANPEICKRLDYSREELLQMSTTDIDDNVVNIQKNNHPYQLLKNGTGIFEVTHISKSGKKIPTEISARTIQYNDQKAVLAVCRDLTERKEAEKENARLITILESTSDFVSSAHPDGKLIYINSFGKKLVGLKKNENVSRKKISDLHPEWALNIIMEQGIPAAIKHHIWRGETALLTKKGKEIPVSQIIMSHKSPDNGIDYFSTIMRDISDIKKAERIMLEEKLFSDTLINSLPGIFYLYDNKHRLIRWNKNYETVTGYSPKELNGMPVSRVIRESDRPMIRKKIDELETLGSTDIEASLLTKNGHSIPYYLVGTRLGMNNSNYLIGTGIDISERKKTEEHLRHAQKMEAIGTLAGGIAHDFNNILTAIIGSAELMMVSVENDFELKESIQDILSAGTRASKLVKQLLAFSRKQILHPQVVNVHHIIKNLKKMIQHLIRENIQLEIVFHAQMEHVKVDANQLEQALINLIINASNAMPDRGKLSIETDNLIITEDNSNDYESLEKGPYVMISVKDTGNGIENEILPKIFDPFFTTKADGHGTGLGLAMAYGTIKQHGGILTVSSEKGKGSIFRIILPQSTNTAQSHKTEKLPKVNHIGKETILIAEDEIIVSNLLSKTLSKLGYTILQATDVHDAITRAEKHKQSLHLLITDIIMPEMNGKELYLHIQKLCPNVKVLYISGYSHDILSSHELDEGEINFIPKPFSIEEISSKVREILDNR